jgi:molybdate transport system substrate-binding protein
VRAGRRVAAALAVVAVTGPVAASGCGSDDSADSSGSSGSRPTLIVSAAASLKNGFERCAQRFDAARLRFSFAGSDELAAQIRQGARPDVYAAANAKLPDQLAGEGLLEKPVVFAGNRLVIAVPKDSSIGSIDDLGKSGTKLVIGAKDVPVGSYTLDVLGRLPASERKAILANVKSEEPDVAGVVGKLTQGAADAGFTYITDVVGTKGALKVVELPANLQPSVQYGMGVVRGDKQAGAGRAFIVSLVSGPCRQVMRAAGFEPPPSP